MGLKDRAKKATEANLNSSALTEGREKIKLEELVAIAGNKLHIDGVDILQVNDKDQDGNKIKRDAAAMTVTEDQKHWTFGGALLSSIINEWRYPSDQDTEALTLDQINNELRKDPLLVKIEKRSQKNDPRKTYWHYEIMD